KLGDFGLARSIGIPIKHYTAEVVTMWYRAPELIMRSQTYSSAIDLWSVGTVLAEMVIKEPLFRGDSDIDQIHRILNILGKPSDEDLEKMPYFNKSYFTYQFQPEDEILEKLKRAGESGVSLLLGLLDYVPGRRFCAREAMQHKFFKQNE
ncbi:cell division protein kinase, putative, partial [Entamoeba invadens IP1]|uniref:cell division protein kinase, putative n=1 Tax=Entamoeba invadens IP1 TaxID=370355 RepID=UPI0002C3CF36